MTTLTLLLATSTFAQPLHPPFRREWTALTELNPGVVSASGNRLVYVGSKWIGAIDLRSGKTLWKHEVAAWNWAANGHFVFALTRLNGALSLNRFDQKTGQQRQLVPNIPNPSGLISNEDAVFSFDDQRILTSYDSHTGRKHWQRTLRSVDADYSTRWLSGRSRIYAITPGKQMLAIDPKTGATAWHVNLGGGYGQTEFTVSEGLVAIGDEKIRCYDEQNGRVRWEASDLRNSWQWALIGKSLVGWSSELAKVINTDTGISKHLGALQDKLDFFAHGGAAMVPVHQDRALFEGFGWLSLVNLHGQTIWSSRRPGGNPIYFDGHRLVMNDGRRFVSYTNGLLLPIPKSVSARRALASRLASQFEILSSDEREQLIPLGSLAFLPLLQRYVGNQAKRKGMWQYDNDTTGADAELLEILDRVTGPKDTEALMSAIREKQGTRSWGQPSIIQILEAHGPKSRVIPFLVSELRQRKGIYLYEMLAVVAKSDHPAAVQFLIDALRDPKAPKDWRAEAYLHLAATGGAAGAHAVLDARRTRKPEPSWQSVFARQNQTINTRVAAGKDAKGRIWRLVTAGALGNWSDLYLQSWDGEVWSEPLFTGLYTSRTWTLPAPKECRGIPVSKFLKTDWLRIWPDDEQLRRDTDGDGLTDLVEERLGTDPNKADTDGDGMPDAIDPCPNAPIRPLGDREKIIAACVDSLFFDEQQEVPAVIEVRGVKPFELYGYRARVIWETPPYKGSLPKMYNTGVNQLAFSSAVRSDGQGDWLDITANGREAKTLISRYSGGLNGVVVEMRLKKIGDEWFVVGCETVAVS